VVVLWYPAIRAQELPREAPFTARAIEIHSRYEGFRKRPTAGWAISLRQHGIFGWSKFAVIPQLSLDLVVPDRFEGLRDAAPNQLKSIIVPVEAALRHINDLYSDMTEALRGAFLILRGDPGVGKTTFLHTLPMFLEAVEVISIPSSETVEKAVSKLPKSSARLRLLVLEGREALHDIPLQKIEADLHFINVFIRTTGRDCLVVWPCNTDDLQSKLVDRAKDIGDDALLGTGDPVYLFSGPDRPQYRLIAEQTVAVLNQGATLADLGVSEDEIDKLTKNSQSVGRMLGQLRNTMRQKKKGVTSLLRREQCKLWVVVAAGNEPDRDVAALTRGRYSAIDIERLMSATEANIVEELKPYPDKLGILGTVLDAKIYHLPMLAALDIVRTYADSNLRRRMKSASLADRATATTKALDRLGNTDLGRIFSGGSHGPMSRGARPGSNTEEAFKKLASIAQRADTALNRAFAEALKDAGYVTSYATEKNLGSGLTRTTDILCESSRGTVRLEMMWRSKTSRADIANYVLIKLYNYGRAIGFLSN